MGGNTNVPLMQDQIRDLLPLSTKQAVHKLLGEGLAPWEIASKLGTCDQTVRRHIRSLAREGTLAICELPHTMAKREADLASGSYVLETQINVIEQLKDANDAVWSIVERLEKAADDRGTQTIGEVNAMIRALGEVRQQLQLQADLSELMLRLQTIKDFQDEVLSAIEGVDPIVASKIRTKLIERKTMRASIGG